MIRLLLWWHGVGDGVLLHRITPFFTLSFRQPHAMGHQKSSPFGRGTFGLEETYHGERIVAPIVSHSGY